MNGHFTACERCVENQALGRFEIRVLSEDGNAETSEYVEYCESCLKETSLWCDKHGVPSLVHFEGDQSDDGTQILLTACSECIADTINAMSPDELTQKTKLLGMILPEDLRDLCAESEAPKTLRSDSGAHELFVILWTAELQKETFVEAVTTIVSSTCAHA